jgi:hypothetical protein
LIRTIVARDFHKTVTTAPVNFIYLANVVCAQTEHPVPFFSAFFCSQRLLSFYITTPDLPSAPFPESNFFYKINIFNTSKIHSAEYGSTPPANKKKVQK